MEEDKIIEEANVNDNYGRDVEEEELDDGEQVEGEELGDGEQVEGEELGDDEDRSRTGSSTQQATSEKPAHSQTTKRRRKLLKNKVCS